jgi:hypothetical protein
MLDAREEGRTDDEQVGLETLGLEYGGRYIRFYRVHCTSHSVQGVAHLTTAIDSSVQ